MSTTAKKAQKNAPPVQTFVPILSARQLRSLNVRRLLWMAAVIIFWYWWLSTANYATALGFVVNSAVLLYVTIMPSYFFFFIGRMKRVNRALPIPHLRVAIITTRYPKSEPFRKVKKTLRGMLTQKMPYKYDVWLADEDPDDRVKAWCKKRGVQLSTRKHDDRYHNADWPRRRGCKEGNLAYFYDNYGYDRYDVVMQLDADHVPSKTYALEIIRAFSDPKIGYVAAPSICNRNQQMSWAVRGRLYSEATLHGPLQAGFNGGLMPLCIGSHYAVRTKALQEAGGLGPELAEDLSTTLAINSKGWDGAFAIDAIAVGDGPQNFYDCMKQESQWARSIFNLLMGYVPRVYGGLSWRKKLQVSYSLLWYLILSVTSFTGYLLPVVAVSLAIPIVQVNYLLFIYFMMIINIITLDTAVFLRRIGLLRPKHAPILAWEALLFNIGRWPWVVWGLLQSIGDRFRSIPFAIKVTPKHGASSSRQLPLRHLSSYILIFLALVVPLQIRHDELVVGGYYYVALVAAFWYLLFVGAVLYLHRRETGQRLQWKHIGVLQGMIVLFLLGVYNASPEMAHAFNAMSKGIEYLVR